MNFKLLRRGVKTLSPVNPRGDPTSPLEVYSGTGVFVGYASLFNMRDQAGDVVMPGAFTKSLQKRGPENIRMLFQHDPAEPVGTWIDIIETPMGLYVRGRLDTNVQRGRELKSLLESGGIDGLSIGFKTVRATQDRIGKSRKLLEIDLWEISLVTFPMLEGARVSRTQHFINKFLPIQLQGEPHGLFNPA